LLTFAFLKEVLRKHKLKQTLLERKMKNKKKEIFKNKKYFIRYKCIIIIDNKQVYSYKENIKVLDTKLWIYIQNIKIIIFYYIKFLNPFYNKSINFQISSRKVRRKKEFKVEMIFSKIKVN